VQQGIRIGWAAGDVNVHGNYRIHGPTCRVDRTENAAAASAGTDSDDESRVRGGVVGLLKGEFHVARNGARHEQHVSVPRGGDKVNAEAFDVIDRTV